MEPWGAGFLRWWVGVSRAKNSGGGSLSGVLQQVLGPRLLYGLGCRVRALDSGIRGLGVGFELYPNAF